MCGLFGFVGTGGGTPDAGLLKIAAVCAAARGPDSWGAVWEGLDGEGVWTEAARFAGTFPASVARASVVIGHCRLATSGGTGVIQPLSAGRLWIAHNGNFYGAERIRAERGLSAVTACDSEVLGLLAAAADGPLDAAVVGALAAAERPSRAAVAVWDRSARAVALVPAGQPVYTYRTGGGVYWSSVNPGGWALAAGPHTYHYGGAPVSAGDT